MPDKKFTQKMQQSWKQIANLWKTYTPPVKPSPAEVHFYESKIKELILLQKRKKLKALILGATPEFRDLLAQYKIDTTLIDNNQASVKAMTSLVKRKNPREKIVFGNWFKMPFKKNNFNLVLSDTSQDNIKFKDFEKFFKSVSKVLKPDGYWLSGNAHFENKNSLKFSEYLKMYKRNPKHFKNIQNFIGNFFRLCYQPEFYNPKTRIFDFTKVDTKIKDLVTKNKLPKSALKDLCFNIDYAQPVISLNELKKILNKKFSIVAEMQDDSHPSMKIRWSAILKPKK